MPVRVLWGGQGVIGRCFDVLPIWRDAAENVSGRALDCGHYLAEERPEEVLAEMLEFFAF
jgi:haloacetate dehalogenase